MRGYTGGLTDPYFTGADLDGTPYRGFPEWASTNNFQPKERFVKDYGYDRISKTEGSGVIIQGFHYEFKKGTILEFRVGETNTDLKYNNSDVINKSVDG